MLTTALAPLSPTGLGITAVAVMAVPTTAVHDASDRVVIERAAYRVVGCLIGAGLGMIGVKLASGDFLVWLVFIMAGTWLASQNPIGDDRHRLCRDPTRDLLSVHDDRERGPVGQYRSWKPVGLPVSSRPHRPVADHDVMAVCRMRDETETG